MSDNQRTSLAWLGWSALVSFLAIAQFRLLLIVLGSRLEPIVKAAYGITEGVPHWRIFQSRVLGPYMAEAVSSILGIGYQFGFMVTVFLLLLAFYASMVSVFRQIFQDTTKIVFACALVFVMNTVLIQGYWLYLWDLVDLIIFTWLIWAVLTRQSIWFILSILAFEVFNREIVLLIAAWLLFDALVKVTPGKPGTAPFAISINRMQAIASLAFIAVAFFTIELLRDNLLVREVGPEIFSDVKASGKFLNFQLANNIQALLKAFTAPLHNYNIVFVFIIFSIPVLAVLRLLSAVATDADKRIAVLFIILWASTMCFGLIFETRVWLLFVPYLAVTLIQSVYAASAERVGT